jgi:hypothetical protein
MTSLNVGLVVVVSPFALIVLNPTLLPFAQ